MSVNGEILIKNTGFEPSIYKYLSNDDKNILNEWQMSTRGKPVPTPHNAKVAIWYGEALRLEEIPVLSVITPRAINSPSAVWLFGVSERYDGLPVEQRREQYAESAEYYAPNGLVTAVAGLRRFLGYDDPIYE